MLAKKPDDQPHGTESSKPRSGDVAQPKGDWMRAVYPKAADRLPVYSTVSGMEVDSLYTPDDLAEWAYDQQLGHHWLRFRLEGTRCNRDAIGAWVEVQIDGRTLPVRRSAETFPVNAPINALTAEGIAMNAAAPIHAPRIAGAPAAIPGPARPRIGHGRVAQPLAQRDGARPRAVNLGRRRADRPGELQCLCCHRGISLSLRLAIS